MHRMEEWDWGRDDDGNWIAPLETPPDDPNQLCFPFLFDELEILKLKHKLKQHEKLVIRSTSNWIMGLMAFQEHHRLSQ